jgi:holo-[acyl-carrier protein] synthase
VVIGVGTDILGVERLHDVLEDASSGFVDKIFTEREKAQADRSGDALSYFATRFAGKEAVFKCFNIHGNVRLNEIEIIDGETGQPQVTLLGRFLEIARERGVRDVKISLSYENDYAVAFALAQD